MYTVHFKAKYNELFISKKKKYTNTNTFTLFYDNIQINLTIILSLSMDRNALLTLNEPTALFGNVILSHQWPRQAGGALRWPGTKAVAVEGRIIIYSVRKLRAGPSSLLIDDVTLNCNNPAQWASSSRPSPWPLRRCIPYVQGPTC